MNFNGLNVEIEALLKALFPFGNFDLQEDFKYLGFILKQNGYKKGDWGWLLSKTEKKDSFLV